MARQRHAHHRPIHAALHNGRYAGALANRRQERTGIKVVASLTYSRRDRGLVLSRHGRHTNTCIRQCAQGTAGAVPWTGGLVALHACTITHVRTAPDNKCPHNDM
eukprot:358478-Chlamydomonas_euryale.AAC.10